jgi:hypothetical protein
MVNAGHARRHRFVPRLVSLIATGCALAPPVAMSQTRLNFVSCPIVRDTPTVPCWLTRYEGELYYMGIQTDVSAEFDPPYLGHEVLVEGVVADESHRICGGIVLEPIRISVMPELNGSCNTILPVDPRYTIDFNPRPPGPSAGRLAFSAPPAVAVVEDPAASGPKTFTFYFEIDRGVAFGHPPMFDEILEHAAAIDATRIIVSGVRGSTLLTNGTVVIESENTAERRSGQIATLLAGLGAKATIDVEYSRAPEPADGVDDWMSRRVDVLVAP